jgi:hypothetical protein
LRIHNGSMTALMLMPRVAYLASGGRYPLTDPSRRTRCRSMSLTAVVNVGLMMFFRFIAVMFEASSRLATRRI